MHQGMNLLDAVRAARRLGVRVELLRKTGEYRLSHPLVAIGPKQLTWVEPAVARPAGPHSHVNSLTTLDTAVMNISPLIYHIWRYIQIGSEKQIKALSVLKERVSLNRHKRLSYVELALAAILTRVAGRAVRHDILLMVRSEYVARGTPSGFVRRPR